MSGEMGLWLGGSREIGGPEVNFRNEIEILGGYLKVAQMNSWGWEGTTGEVGWISGRVLGTGRTEEELQDGWG